ncbi:MAG TPA: DUF4167 domain-containing protein [Xanthobacteraceae bacterium]|jgi:hypothetical protein
MRNGQNKRMRGRNNNHRKSHNPMARVYESNGPDVKIRGNPSHIAEKYIQLARDAQASGDPIAAENYYQHAEHYYRVIAAAQEQYRQANPHFARAEGEFSGPRDEAFEEGDDSGQQAMESYGEPRYGTREPQPYLPRDVQPYQQGQPPQHQSFRPPQTGVEAEGEPDQLPSFITGAQPSAHQHQPSSGPAQNGHDGHRDRFPLHRRRRRHRGPRHDLQGGSGGPGMDEPSRQDD